MDFRIEGKFYILSLTFLCSVFAVHADPSGLCPPSELIEPCTCRSNCIIPTYCTVYIDCDDIDDQEVLSRVFAIEYQFSYFTLKQATVLYLPDNFFEVRGLRYLKVVDSSFVSLFNHSTTEDNAIGILILERVQILRGFDWRVLSGFRSLTSVDLRQVEVPKIDQSFVDHAPKGLIFLHIDDCSSTTIHDEAFAGLPELLSLYVRDGKIKELKRSMFPAPTPLVWLDFSGNLLSSLPDDIFSGMPKLQHIVLSGNLLTEISENVFRNTFLNLIELVIEDNPLKCQCNIRWITQASKPSSRLLGSCMEPKILHGKLIRDLVPGDFTHCAHV